MIEWSVGLRITYNIISVIWNHWSSFALTFHSTRLCKTITKLCPLMLNSSRAVMEAIQTGLWPEIIMHSFFIAGASSMPSKKPFDGIVFSTPCFLLILFSKLYLNIFHLPSVLASQWTLLFFSSFMSTPRLSLLLKSSHLQNLGWTSSDRRLMAKCISASWM